MFVSDLSSGFAVPLLTEPGNIFCLVWFYKDVTPTAFVKEGRGWRAGSTVEAAKYRRGFGSHGWNTELTRMKKGIARRWRRAGFLDGMDGATYRNSGNIG